MNKQEKIESVRRGEYAWHNDGTFEQLQKVIKLTFPNDRFIENVDEPYITTHGIGEGKKYWRTARIIDLPTHSIKEMFEMDDKKK